MKKIVVCGGHLTPALALIEEFNQSKGIKILFFGRKYATEGSKSLSAEYRVITEKKIKFYSISTGRLQRKFTKYTLPSLLKIPSGFLQVFVLLIVERPSLIVSFGGYLSLPIVFCGWLLGIDSVSHEQSSVPGLATKINSVFVKRLFLSWPATYDFFQKDKSEVIGNLIRQSIFKTTPRGLAIRNFLSGNKKLIFVTGGNQGSHFLNGLIFNSLDLLKNFSILHQVGTLNFKGDLDFAKKISKNNYLAVGYIQSVDLGAVFNKASVVICRSGANTCWELATLAKPAILIPLPIAASREQEQNARILEKAGSGVILKQKSLNPKILKTTLGNINKDYSEYQNAARRFGKTLPKDASKKMANYIRRLLAAR